MRNAQATEEMIVSLKTVVAAYLLATQILDWVFLRADHRAAADAAAWRAEVASRVYPEPPAAPDPVRVIVVDETGVPITRDGPGGTK
jgi:hypothetical protein